MGIALDEMRRRQEQEGTVYYDPAKGQYYTISYDNMLGVTTFNSPGVRTYIGSPGSGQTAYTPPTVNFNNLPNQIPTGLQVYGAGNQATPYQRPTQPTAPAGTGYRPQFDPTFIQQMLAQRFGNNQGSGIPTATRPVGPPTLTPGATQTYGGYQGQGGLGALRAIANPAPVATGGQGETV